MTGSSQDTQAVIERVDLALVIEFSDDATLGVTDSGTISSCNRAAARLYGYPQQGLVGCEMAMLIPPECRAEEAKILRLAMAGEQVESYRTYRIRRDGEKMPVTVTQLPIRDSTGRIVGTANLTQRVGELRESQQLAETLVAPAERTEYRVQDAQDQQLEAHIEAEYAKERVQVRNAQDRFQDRMGEERIKERVEVQEAQDRFQATMGDEGVKERVQVYAAQDRFQDRMSEERAHERVQVQEAQDRFQIAMDAGRTQAKDHRRYLEAQLHQSQRLEVLGQLAGGVAHDFNNLLAVILNYTAFVAEELTRPEADLVTTIRDVGQIQRAAERAAELTHQLLAFARREVVQPRVLDLNRVVVEVEQLLRRTIGADVLLRTELAENLWPVLADAGQLEQVLVNLAVNARDAMGTGGTLSIETANTVVPDDSEVLLRAGRHVRLRVTDTGTGMPAEVIEHVYEPFFTTKPEGAGTGLGLSTVYGIVVQAEGTITIRSQPGEGTTFTILLPATDEILTPDKENLSYERTPSGETILIVEDQDALRQVTERIFTRSGYQVITAENGDEAISLAANYEGEIHLLLTDVVMPSMLGKEVAERIRRIRPDIQVLFMSGYAQPVLASEGKLDRDVNLIEKPFTAAAIVEKAGKILNGNFEGFRTLLPSEDNSRSKSEIHPEPNSGSHPGTNSESRPEINPGTNPGTNSGSHAEKNSGSHSGTNSGSHAGTNAGTTPETKPGTTPEPFESGNT